MQQEAGICMTSATQQGATPWSSTSNQEATRVGTTVQKSVQDAVLLCHKTNSLDLERHGTVATQTSSINSRVITSQQHFMHTFEGKSRQPA
jgi:hypothetical protein